MSRLAIITLNWNGLQDTLACLASLRKSTHADTRVYVVDNGSTDDAVRVIPERFPEVRLIASPTNLGFAGGNNLGLRHALDDDADAILFLNNDTVVPPGTLSCLVAALQHNADYGSVGPLVCHHADPNRVQTAGGRFYRAIGRCRHVYKDVPVSRVPRQPFEVEYVGGVACMIRRDVLDKVGGFDDAFHPAYSEDVDLGLRIQQAGYRNLCIPAARVLHKWSAATGGGRNATKMYLIARSTRRLLRKHGHPLLNATTVPPAWLGMCLLESAAGLLRRDLSVARAMWRGWYGK